jgi:hypothetical protein
LSLVVVPSVESETNEPASPTAPATANTMNMLSALRPILWQVATNIPPKSGTVEKDDPMPNATIKATIGITIIAKCMLFDVRASSVFTRSSTAPVPYKRPKNPEAIIMMIRLVAIIPTPSVTMLSESFHFIAPDSRNPKNPESAPATILLNSICMAIMVTIDGEAKNIALALVICLRSIATLISL